MTPQPKKRRSKLAGLNAITPPPAPEPTATDEAAEWYEQDTTEPTTPVLGTKGQNQDAATTRTTKSTAKNTKATTKTTKTEVARATPVQVSFYLNVATRDLARAAYVSDFARLGADAPNGFDHWIGAAAERYAALSAKQRAKRLAALPDEPVAEKKSYKARLSESTVEAIDRGIAADAENGLYKSRSPWVIEAMRLGIEEARERAGGTLPEPPAGRLPIRPRTTR